MAIQVKSYRTYKGAIKKYTSQLRFYNLMNSQNKSWYKPSIDNKSRGSVKLWVVTYKD